jgi:hypothetical protein
VDLDEIILESLFFSLADDVVSVGTILSSLKNITLGGRRPSDSVV